jgi:recombination protein U
MANKTQGNQFEAVIDQENDILRAQGYADVMHIPDPVKVLRRTKKGEVVGHMESKSTVDYAGTIKGGLAVAFDAKSTKNETRFEFKCLERKKGKARSQREILATQAALGAIAFVYVKHQPDGIAAQRYYVFPVDAKGRIAGVSDDDRRSINFAHADLYRLRPGETWFNAIVRLYGEANAPALENETLEDETDPVIEDIEGNAGEALASNLTQPIRRMTSVASD